MQNCFHSMSQTNAARGSTPFDAFVSRSLCSDSELPTASLIKTIATAKQCLGKTSKKEISAIWELPKVLAEPGTFRATPKDCTQSGSAGSVASLPALWISLIAFAKSAYQNKKNVCSHDQRLLPEWSATESQANRIPGNIAST